MNIPLLLAMAALIALSAFFSASETAFSSANRLKLKALAAEKNKRAKKVLALTENYSKLLSTILVGNNLVNISLSAIATIFFIDLIENQSIATVVSTAVITLLVLIFGEVTPKTLAKESPEKFAMFSCGIMKALCALLTPVNFFFGLWSKLLLKVFRIKKETAVTEEELLTIVEEAEHGGGIEKDDGEIIRSAIEFKDLDVEDVLTPRVDVIAVDISDSKEEIYDAFRKSGYSRLPVYKGTVDNIVGVINQKDFYEKVMLGTRRLRSIVFPATFVTPYMKISDLMKILQRSKSHMAIVLDEFGGTIGIVTLEDIIEELVGEIWDERDEVTEEIVPLGNDVYRVDGGVSLYKLFNLFDVDDSEEDDEEQPQTLAGLVMKQFESIPEVGKELIYKNLKITVVKADEAHIETLTVQVLPGESEE